MQPDSRCFDMMTSADADKECGTMGGFYGEDCPVCENRVILHCDKCKIQVSSCKCTLAMKRIAESEDDLRTLEEMEKSESTRERLADRGIWIPPSAH